MCIFFFPPFFSFSACLFVVVFVWLDWCLLPKQNLDLSPFLCSFNNFLCPGYLKKKKKKTHEMFNLNKVGGPNASQRFLFKAACIHPEKQCKTNAEIGYERWPVSFPGHRLPLQFGFQVGLRSIPPSFSTHQTQNPYFNPWLQHQYSKRDIFILYFEKKNYN